MDCCQDQKDAVYLFYPCNIPGPAEMGKENSGGTPGNGGGEDISDVWLQLFSHNKAGNSGGWEEK